MQSFLAGSAVYHGSDRPGRRALAEWTLRRLYGAIFSGELQAGDVLIESDLTQRLGVSRSPLREALKQLEVDRLAVTSEVNGRRTVVAFEFDDCRELYEIRAVLERLSFATAASAISDAELAELRAIQERMDELLAARQREGRLWQPRDFALDFRFHELVCEVANLTRLQAILSPLWMQTWALIHQLDSAGIYPTDAEIQAGYRDHHALLDALARRDSKGAAETVEAHIFARRDHFLEAMSEAGEGWKQPIFPNAESRARPA